MGALDVIPIPGYPGKWARRCVVDAWQKAGSPAVLWGGRTKKQQRALYNLWRAGEGNAADNPDGNTRMPHVRGMALDLADPSPSAAVVKAMMRAGFTRPIWVRNGYSQDEPWHFELAAYVSIIRSVPLVEDAPKPSGSGAVASVPKPNVPEEDDMFENEDRARLNAVYSAMFGSRNLTDKDTATTWVAPNGNSQSTKYGVLPIDIETQRMIADLQVQVAAIAAKLAEKS